MKPGKSGGRIETVVRLRRHEEKQVSLEVARELAALQEREDKLRAAEAEVEKLLRQLDIESVRLDAKVKKGIKVSEADAAVKYLGTLRHRLEHGKKEVASARDELEKAASRLGVAQAKLREKSAQKKAAEKYLSGRLKKDAAAKERKEEL